MRADGWGGAFGEYEWPDEDNGDQYYCKHYQSDEDEESLRDQIEELYEQNKEEPVDEAEENDEYEDCKCLPFGDLPEKITGAKLNRLKLLEIRKDLRKEGLIKRGQCGWRGNNRYKGERKRKSHM